MKFKAVTVLAVALSIAAVGVSNASAATSRHYMDELALSNQLESKGFIYNNHRVAVDSAFCMGLRRYGVKTSEWGLDKYWHFDCTVSAANGHDYEVYVATTQNAHYFYTNYYRIVLNF